MTTPPPCTCPNFSAEHGHEYGCERVKWLTAGGEEDIEIPEFLRRRKPAPTGSNVFD